MTPDVNVLIAAFRRDHQHHAVAFRWLDGARAPVAAQIGKLHFLGEDYASAESALLESLRLRLGRGRDEHGAAQS